VVELDGRVAGVGLLIDPPGMSGLFGMVLVDDRVRGQGAGRVLERALSDAAAGMDVLTAMLDGDARSRAVAEHWGFEVWSHSVPSRLDLARVPPEPVPLPAGHELVVGSLSDLRVAGYDPDALLSVASTHPESRLMGQMRAEELETAVPLLWVLDVAGGAPLALSCVVPAASGPWLIPFTCVHPAHRHQGLARLVKDRLHREVAARGGDIVKTLNEAGNAGMRRLNAAMGYEHDGRGVVRLRRAGGQRP